MLSYKVSLGEIINPYLHIILLIIFLVIVLFLFHFKYKHKHWLNQVIHNNYDPRLWGKKGFIVNKAKITKYYDSLIYSTKWSELNYTMKCACSWFLNKKYNYYQGLKLKLTTKKLTSLFEKHNKPCYISLKYENNQNKQKITGCIISRPIEGRFYNKDLNLYTFDYICGEKTIDYFKILYTHFKNHRDTHNGKIFLFHTTQKIEIATSLININTNLYSIKFFPKKVIQRYSGISIQLISSSNYRLFMNTFYKLYEVFDCFLHIHMTQLLYLLDQKILYIVVYLSNNKVLCCYFFKNNSSLHNQSQTITLIGSYKGTEYEDMFIDGFYNSVVYVSNSLKIKSILVDDLGHNTILLKSINKYKIVETFKSFLYLYNFVYSSFNKDQVLLLL
jgi:hypothetical protein